MKTPALSELSESATAVVGNVTEVLGDAWHGGADRLAGLASVAADRAGDVTHVVTSRLPDPDAVRKVGRRAARQTRKATARVARREQPQRDVPTLALIAIALAVIGAALWWRGRHRGPDPAAVGGWSTASPTTPEETAALVGG